MSKIPKKKKQMRRGFALLLASARPNCEGRGPHFAQPSFGEPGFYICRK